MEYLHHETRRKTTSLLSHGILAKLLLVIVLKMCNSSNDISQPSVLMRLIPGESFISQEGRLSLPNFKDANDTGLGIRWFLNTANINRMSEMDLSRPDAWKKQWNSPLGEASIRRPVHPRSSSVESQLHLHRGAFPLTKNKLIFIGKRLGRQAQAAMGNEDLKNAHDLYFFPNEVTEATKRAFELLRTLKNNTPPFISPSLEALKEISKDVVRGRISNNSSDFENQHKSEEEINTTTESTLSGNDKSLDEIFITNEPSIVVFEKHTRTTDRAKGKVSATEIFTQHDVSKTHLLTEEFSKYSVENHEPVTYAHPTVQGSTENLYLISNNISIEVSMTRSESLTTLPKTNGRMLITVLEGNTTPADVPWDRSRETVNTDGVLTSTADSKATEAAHNKSSGSVQQRKVPPKAHVPRFTLILLMCAGTLLIIIGMILVIRTKLRPKSSSPSRSTPVELRSSRLFEDV